MEVPPTRVRAYSIQRVASRRETSDSSTMYMYGVYVYLYHAYYESYNLIGQCEVLYFTY